MIVKMASFYSGQMFADAQNNRGGSMISYSDPRMQASMLPQLGKMKVPKAFHPTSMKLSHNLVGVA